MTVAGVSPQSVTAQRITGVTSPDGKLRLELELGDKLSYSVFHGEDLMIAPSKVSMTLSDGTICGEGKEMPHIKRSAISQTLSPIIYRKKTIVEQCSQIELRYRKYSVFFRVYNSGIAYRFVLKADKSFKIINEQATFNLPEDWNIYIPYVRDFDVKNPEAQFGNSFENTYSYSSLSKWEKGRLAFLPLLIEACSGKKILITESDLADYPGMYLTSFGEKNSLYGIYAPVPEVVEQGGHNNLQGIVKSRKDYIAEYDIHSRGTEVRFPWRIVTIAQRDVELLDNDLVYCLAEPEKQDVDFSWVKPGKVAWDWWNKWNIYGVDFKSGINNQTYMHYIDFASEHNIPYVILDEGWAVNGKADLYQVVPEIDLEHLVSYASSKNVGIILWAGYWALNRDIESICKYFSELGVKGFKVDFMDRDDQYMVRFVNKLAEVAAKYHLIIDYHGAYKPTGLQRTWPNAINYEGVHGLEQMKWSAPSVDQVTYDVTVPFIRMVAGPMDYTQGAMRNATKGNYRPISSEAMSQGTRCRQLAEYVVFESPFNMLCDSPSNYRNEKECTEFIASVPEIWDETIVLDGKVGKYVAIARRSGEQWYVGVMTDWKCRSISLDLSVLGIGKTGSADSQWVIEIYSDGINADKAARDYKHQTIDFPNNGKIDVSLAPGGGYVAKIYRR